MNPTIDFTLNEDWKIQSSVEVTATGVELSTDPELTGNWFPARIPSTVLGILAENKIYENPYYGENLKVIPREPFKVPWWYVTSFRIDEVLEGYYGQLLLDGINYSANIWLNGHLVADTQTVNGAYSRPSVDVSKALVTGNNLLAVEVIPPQLGDFSTGFVDWNPAPPDGNTGIFRPVTLKLHQGVRLEEPFVRCDIDPEAPESADLTVSVKVQNHQDRETKGIIRGEIGEIRFELAVELDANSEKTVLFRPEDFPQLVIQDPKLWWPYDMGIPHLYNLKFRFLLNGQISDQTQTKFGIRKIEDFWLNDIHRGYKINGRKILIRGGGWTDDLLLMDSHEKIEAQVKYVKDMNLNCIRLEGMWGNDKKLYDLCDEEGILLMAGWSCHWEHEVHMKIPVSERYGAVYKPEDIDLVARMWRDQVLWLRNHPSIFVWTVASDKVPITELEQKYIDIFAEIDPDRPYLNSTGGVGSDQHIISSEDVISEISGSSGMKMLGPYDYTAPGYWYTDTTRGGAYGFNTETGPGAQPPQLESIRKFIPEEQLWPVNEVWDYHCGLYEFATFRRFTDALSARYGTSETLEEFDRKAQVMNYELMRPMFEAFRINKEKTTGVVQWMLNAAWPKMYWQLYDYYLNPNGAYYATKKACAPLQLMYHYGNAGIYAVNDLPHEVKGLRALIRIFDIHSVSIREEEIPVELAPDSSLRISTLALPADISETYFIDLRLFRDEEEINQNFYWLSTREEILDYEADLGDFPFHTPSKQYADLRLLDGLPVVGLGATYRLTGTGPEKELTVELQNNGEQLAFMNNLKVLNNATKEPVLPVIWDDNFVTLLPGEKRKLKATFSTEEEISLKIEGWNANDVYIQELKH